MKIPYRQAMEAVLALSPDYRFSSMELTLLLRFIASLGEDVIDLQQVKDTPRAVWKGILRCTNEPYVSRLFTALEEKGAMSSTRIYESNGYRAYRSLNPAFAEAIRCHA
jgi:hypothetical protein